MQFDKNGSFMALWLWEIFLALSATRYNRGDFDIKQTNAVRKPC